MRKFLFVAAASLFIFGKCNKDENTTATADFLPLNTGTYWKYLTTNTTTTTTTADLTLTVTNKDTTVNSKVYKVLTNSTGANNYWAKIGSDYYRYGAFPGATFIGSVEELYFKDNVAVNGTWTNSFPITYNSIPITITANYKIAATGQSKTVTAGSSTKSFTDVTQVQVTFTTAVPPLVPTTTLGSGNFYYAKGIGLIAQDITISANPAVGITASAVKWDISDYQIK